MLLLFFVIALTAAAGVTSGADPAQHVAKEIEYIPVTNVYGEHILITRDTDTAEQEKPDIPIQAHRPIPGHVILHKEAEAPVNENTRNSNPINYVEVIDPFGQHILVEGPAEGVDDDAPIIPVAAAAPLIPGGVIMNKRRRRSAEQNQRNATQPDLVPAIDAFGQHILVPASGQEDSAPVVPVAAPSPMIPGGVIMNKRKRSIAAEDFEKPFSTPEVQPLRKNSQIFEGDILVDLDRDTRKGISTGIWTMPIPYYINPNVNEAKFDEGVAYWESVTCLTFEKKTSPPSSGSYLNVIYGNGCYSYVGWINSNGQDLSIGPNCDTLGIVVHEIGHAIGFLHEQSRDDRDQYVKIFEENILPDRFASNFPTSSALGYTEINFSIPYDYASIMHYPSFAFSKETGLRTITTMDPQYQMIIGQRDGLSFKDIKLAKLRYGCVDPSACSGTTCLNDGYADNTNGCACICPAHTTGPNCETVIGPEYSEHEGSSNYMKITSSTAAAPTVELSQADMIKVLEVKAGVCEIPKVTFQKFSFPSAGGYSCLEWSFMEIRFDPAQEYRKGCESDFLDSIEIGPSEGQIILYFDRTSFSYNFEIAFEFMPDPACEPPPSADACDLDIDTPDRKVWRSPNWNTGSSYMGDDPGCTISDTNMASPMKTVVTVYYPNKRYKTYCSKRVVEILAANAEKKICKSNRKTTVTETSPYAMAPIKMSRYGGSVKDRYQVTIQKLQTPCHQYIDVTAPITLRGNFGQQLCEWWLTAPAGKKISVYIPPLRNQRRRTRKRCANKIRMKMDTSGARIYDTDTIGHVVQTYSGKTVVSLSNEMDISYIIAHKRCKLNFDIQISLVD